MKKFVNKHKLMMAYLISVPLFPLILLVLIVGKDYDNWPALICGIILLFGAGMVLVISYVTAQRLSLINRKFEKTNIFFESKYLFLIYLISALYYIYFYTGLDVNSIFVNIATGNSNYALYQLYFKNTISGLSVTQKILPIMCGIFVKFYFVYSSLSFCSKFFSPKAQPRFQDKVFILLVVSILIITALARGTFFEVLELFLVFVYGLLIFWEVRLNKSTLKGLTILILVCCILTYLFYMNIELRGVHKFCVVKDICLAQNSGVFYKLAFLLSGYFLFGVYFIGVTFLYAWNKFGAWTLLFGLQETDKFELRQMICEGFIECGVTWHPEFSVFFGSYGLLISFVIIYFIGFCFGVIQKSWLQTQSIFYLALGYFSMLRIFSLFIGNFVFVSSSNTILYIFSIFIFFMLFRFSSIGQFKK